MTLLDDFRRRPICYKLDNDGEAIPIDPTEMADVFAMDRRVGREELPDGRILSTVFLVVDHGFVGPPILFETAVIPLDGDIEIVGRYCCREWALRGHENLKAAMVDKATLVSDFESVCPKCFGRFQEKAERNSSSPESSEGGGGGGGSEAV